MNFIDLANKGSGTAIQLEWTQQDDSKIASHLIC